MAKNIYSLQLLRNSQIFQDKAAAIAGITGSTTQDGVIKLARYTDGTATKTIFGIYNDGTIGTAGYTIYDSYQEVIADIQERIADLESGSTEINKKLGSGVTTANTVTDQLEALSGDSSTAQSGDTSVEGAKKYTDGKIGALDYTDTPVTSEYVSAVNETDGVISVTRVALPSLSEVYEEGKPIIAVSEDKGQVAASAGTINAEYVNVADAGELFTATTVEAVLAEIDAAYKAADAAIVGGASASADTLGELEALINDLSADAATYTIRKDTASLPAEIKERYTLVETKNGQSTDKQVTIDIPKDSHIVSINYITTGEHAQNLEYVYIDVSGNTQTTYVDMSELVLETEFASGITVTDHIARGVVDPTSEKDSNNDSFLTVGADGFKVDGIKDEIDAKIGALDATVTDATSGNHISITIEEADGKLVQSGLTIAENNIANATDLAALSAKTVTEIASSNDSITVASGATTAADGTVKYDIITDASKIQMSGFTAAESGFTAIAQSSSVTEAFKAVETYVLENEQVVSAALNDLEETKVENINVNGVEGTFSNKVASVTIDGADIKLDGYASGSSSAAVVATDTVNQAIGKLENQVKAAVAGGLQQVEAGDGVSVSAVANNKQTITVNLKEDVTTTGSEWENPLKFDATSKGLYFDSLDCGTY